MVYALIQKYFRRWEGKCEFFFSKMCKFLQKCLAAILNTYILSNPPPPLVPKPKIIHHIYNSSFFLWILQWFITFFFSFLLIKKGDGVATAVTPLSLDLIKREYENNNFNVYNNVLMNNHYT